MFHVGEAHSPPACTLAPNTCTTRCGLDAPQVSTSYYIIMTIISVHTYVCWESWEPHISEFIANESNDFPSVYR